MVTLDEAIEILSRPKTMKGTPQDILEAHDMAITALRQPEIIRCQDCKYGEFPRIMSDVLNFMVRVVTMDFVLVVKRSKNKHKIINRLT